MKRALCLVIVVAACREKHVPYTPPPPEDALATPIDAPPAIDAAVTGEKPRPTKVAVGDHFSCAVLSDASARCWGKNSDGQLGNGTTTDSATPVKVPIPGVVDIALGTAHACALLDDSSVACWGRINFGAKGVLTKPAAPGVQGAKRIFALAGTSCATLADASLVCWGDVDAKGRPLRSAGEPARRAPTPMPDVDRVIAVTATGALREDGTAWWFGDKVTLEGVTEIAADGDRLCGLRSDGSVICAGPRYCAWKKPKTPAPAIEELALAKGKALAFDAGACVITTAGKQQCLGPDGCKADAPVAPAKFNARATTHTCVLNAGEINCLGSNKHGALGRGEVDDRLHTETKAVAF